MSERASTPASADAAIVDSPDARIAWLPGEQQMVWTVWLTYGAFYFCRTNLSAAVPGMETALSEGGLGLSGTQIGLILASGKIAYGFGQLLNGQFAERVSPRLLLAIGMFGSAALNVVFGLGTGFYFLLFVWATNGYCQSLGWTPCVRVVGNWIPAVRRGRAFGIIGTGYQITLGLTFLIASQSARHLGWRGALFVPSVLLAATAVVMLLSLRETPVQHAASPDGAPPALERRSFVDVAKLTLTNRALWLLGVSLGLVNACRYGFLDWGISHLVTMQQIEIDKAGMQYVVLAIGAAAGSYLAGWATDRFFGGRRAPVIVGLLILLGLLTLGYESVARTSATATVWLLALVGFCIYGPQVLLVGTAPADLARRGTAAAAAGFVNFLGYMGASAGDVVTGYVKDRAHGDWQLPIYIWAGWALAAAIVAAILWNAAAAPDEEK